MPLSNRLLRPMINSSYLKYFAFPLKSIEIFELNTGNYQETKNIKYLEIHPIEGKCCLIFSDNGYSDGGLRMPLPNLSNIKDISSNKLEIYFVIPDANSGANREFASRIKIESKYTDQVFELITTLKGLENDSNYWSHEFITLPTSNGIDKRIEIVYLTPFLAEGEQIIWQSQKFEAKNIKRKVISIDAVTNYRIFQYDYELHSDNAIIFPSIGDVKIVNQQLLVSSSPNGTYTNTSERLTGISKVKTNNVVGDVTFYFKDKSLITFSQVTDPETLVTVIQVLKDRYSAIITSDPTNSTKLKCNKCGNDDISSGSKFCNVCGSQLSIIKSIFDDSE